MKHHIFHQPTSAFRFRRFSRAGYAVFRSLHRVVNIGHLASYIADRQLSKSAVTLAFALPLMTPSVMAQSDTDDDELLLAPVNIIASPDSSSVSPDAVAVYYRPQLRSICAASLGDLLQQLPGIDLRTRGAGDVQADISMRGGTFDQMIILLNGVDFSDAQTGHHNLDLPIDLSMVERIEVIPASALPRYGLSSFCGAVNIVTTPDNAHRLRLLASTGSYRQANLAAEVATSVSGWDLSASASYHSSDGHIDNTDFRHESLLLQAHRLTLDREWSIQLGAQAKDFGSQAFYSVRYPDQFESTRTLLGSVHHRRSFGEWQLDALLYGRLHKDRFELFREGVVSPPSWYSSHNYHRSSLGGSRLSLSRPWRLGSSSLGVDIRVDGVLSNVLGDSLESPRPALLEENVVYPLGIARTTSSLFASHTFTWGRTAFSGTLLAALGSDKECDYGFSLHMSRPLTSNLSISLDGGRSFRRPTYTDLYYHSATQISNPMLHTEHNYSAETSLRFAPRRMLLTGTLFARHGYDIIDWVRSPDSDIWHSVNHAVIDAVGFELQAAYKGSGFLRRAALGYSYCMLLQSADDYISNYVLDYLHQKLTADVLLVPAPHLRVKCLVDYRDRVGGYTDADGVRQSYAPVWLCNLGVEYDLRDVTLFATGQNLLNRQYSDYGGVLQPGFNFQAGLRLTL